MPSTADNSSIPGSAVSRRTLLVLMAGAGAALLAACGGAAQGSPSSGAAGAASAAKPSGSSASEPKLGGTLLVGQVGDLSNADGHSNGLLQNDTSFQAFEPLVVFENGTITPKGVLAESWDLAPDDKQITFHLRKGVQFQTGREFTSDDVKYNFERVQDKKNASIVGINQLSGPAAWWNSIETPDKYTVVLKSDKPRPGVFDSLQKFNMVDKETAEGPRVRPSQSAPARSS
jgi:peptide/nickel transport system substrate-binding protein